MAWRRAVVACDVAVRAAVLLVLCGVLVNAQVRIEIVADVGSVLVVLMVGFMKDKERQ
jgi:hypothetical protein